MSYTKKHDGWQFFKGINKERLRKGKENEAIIFKKIVELDRLPTKDCEFQPTKAWNNKVDFKTDGDIDISIEIKRRFKNTNDEFPFKLDKNIKSTLLTYKKFIHLKENSGWLYLQYNDCLLMLEMSKLVCGDWVECYPFRVHHVSIRLDKFTIIA